MKNIKFEEIDGNKFFAFKKLNNEKLTLEKFYI